MNEPFQLVTNCTFKGKDYLVQMCVLNSKKVELIVTDKIMAEDWQCEYDASYIEAMTHKTGNFKQFDVFVMMLKSGLLKTSDCITLDLLTLEDLEQLRCKKIVNSHSSSRTSQSGHLNKRYLILTYSVEFDRIHYPLPLDYCGPPDPSILQSNIRKLEAENERLKQKNNHLSKIDVADTKKLKDKVQSLTEDNVFLTNEIHRLNKLLSKKPKPIKFNQAIHNSLKKLEEQVLYEKNHNQKSILKLRTENKQLKLQIEELRKSEKSLRMRLREASRVYVQRSRRRLVPDYLSPDNSLERKRGSVGECPPESQLFFRPVSSWNSSATNKPNEFKSFKKSQNRYLSSSSSESEVIKLQKSSSRERKSSVAKQEFSPAKIEMRRSSQERSRQSSDDSKRNHPPQRSRFSTKSKRSNSQEGKPDLAQPSLGIRSRESSVSSRGSSKHSQLSRHSNRGSGDHQIVRNSQTPRSVLDEKEDLKFSMSDLESRIHALQKLLSEGLNF